MSKQDWRVCADPYRMLRAIKGKASERKLLLFTAACVRRLAQFPCEDRDERLAAAGEQLLSDEIAPLAFHQVVAASYGPGHPHRLSRSRAFNAHEQSRYVSEMFRYHAAHGRYSPDDPPGTDSSRVRERERERHCGLLRELFGPHVPLDLGKTWHSPTVLAIAAGIDADRAFDRLPVLADALEDAGCVCVDLLAHCRGVGPHVRGCWAVDLVLGKG